MQDRTHEPLDESALSALIRRETPQFWGVLRSFTDDDGDTEDLLQQLWIMAAERSHHRDARMPLGAWLHVVELNLGRTHHRRASRRQWLRRRWAADLPRTTVDAQPLQLDDVTRAPVWKAVADLPSLQRNVILLRVVEELSTRETAERLGRAEGTVKASLHRAITTLRKHFSYGRATE